MTTIMTMEERSEYERLLTEYANASMDHVRSSNRRHDALHACINWVTERAARAVGARVSVDAPMFEDDVPTGTPPPGVKLNALNHATPVHTSVDPGVPHESCLCIVCNDARAALRVQKPKTWPCRSRPQAEWCDHSGAGGFMGHTCDVRPPILDTSGGN